MRNVGGRLTVTFLAISALLPVLGLLAGYQQRRMTMDEAQNGATALARVIAYNASTYPQLRLDQQPDQVHQHLDELWKRTGLAVTVVDTQERVVASTIPPARVSALSDTVARQVAATISDGSTRAITVPGPRGGEPVRLVIEALRAPERGTVGALVIDYTDLSERLLTDPARSGRIIVGAGFVGMAVALALAYGLSRGTVRDIRRLTVAADRYAAGRYDTRVDVGSHGELRRLAGAFNAMAERVDRRRAALLDLASTDALTGLRNRRAFEADMTRAIAESTAGGSMALILLDLDRFKTINDRYGHAGGDVVLRQVAAILTSELRAADTAARLGGEEFGVVLPGAGIDVAVGVAERLRLVLEVTPAEFQGRLIRVTASLGVVSCPQHGQTFDVLIQRADAALYEAKNAGRNRIGVPPP